jgi:hypothetical protein
MELMDGILLIAASGVGAICGILGQSIKDWLSKPRINAVASADEQTSAVLLYFVNTGRKSTEDLVIDIVSYDGGVLAGNERIIFHTTDMTIHPRTAHSILLGRSEDGVLRIRKSDFSKTVKYSDDSDDEQKEWIFDLPANFYISACARDARACVKVMTVNENDVRLKNPRAVSYGRFKKQQAIEMDSEK